MGDDLGQLTVLGGGNNVFSLTDVDLDVTKNIQGLDIRNGISDSLITAGILIDGGTPGTGSNAWNIGPDGPVAVMDSQILAGSEIDNLTIGGNVESDMPTNPAGLPTRIVAGEYSQGNYIAGGIIDHFQIVGNLIDSVLAASVKPYNGTYPQPAGTIQVGLAGSATTLSNDTGPPFADAGIPTNELVLPGGSINPSFAPALLAVPAAGDPLPMPTEPTVTGEVVTSNHVYHSDYAGIFAADTDGVIVGPLPTS